MLKEERHLTLLFYEECDEKTSSPGRVELAETCGRKGARMRQFELNSLQSPISTVGTHHALLAGRRGLEAVTGVLSGTMDVGTIESLSTVLILLHI